MQRTGVRQYVARNQDGAEIRIGHGPGLFSPGDLLKLAIAGCNAMSSDARLAARLGDDFEQFVGVSGDYDQDKDRFTHVDVELVQDMSALSEEEIEDLKRIQFIYLPPYGPDKNPIEHVWNEAKNSISNLQRADFEDTRDAFETFIRATKFKYRLAKSSC